MRPDGVVIVTPERQLLTGVAQSGREKGGRGRLIGRTKGGLNTKLHAICDNQGRPLNLFVTAGQVSDYIGARALRDSLTDVDWLLGDRGCDADWFREALEDKGIRACIPGRKKQKAPGGYRYDRCPMVFLLAIALAAMVIYWL